MCMHSSMQVDMRKGDMNMDRKLHSKGLLTTRINSVIWREKLNEIKPFPPHSPSARLHKRSHSRELQRKM